MDLFAQMLTELKRAQCPVVIYGAGYVAKKITNYLSEQGITIAGYLVDREYLPAQKDFLNNHVYLVDDFLARNECVVILGFINGFTERHAAKISQNKNAKKFYTLDLLGRFAIDCDSQLTDRFLAENGSVISKLRDDLVDDESKKQLDEFICQKNDGHFWKPFSHKPQYFDDDIITLNEHEVFVDCGAYDGDTILNFIACLGKRQNMSPPGQYEKIFAFEADRTNVKKLEDRTGSLKNVHIIPKGVLDHSGTLCFSAEGTSGSHISELGEQIEVTTIDEALHGVNVTFIKMDIEGAELQALKGAKETIQRCKPKLAICVYHRREDLITIPQYIQSLNAGYKLYFRNYSPHGLEAVIYAI